MAAAAAMPTPKGPPAQCAPAEWLSVKQEPVETRGEASSERCRAEQAGFQSPYPQLMGSRASSCDGSVAAVKAAPTSLVGKLKGKPDGPILSGVPAGTDGMEVGDCRAVTAKDPPELHSGQCGFCEFPVNQGMICKSLDCLTHFHRVCLELIGTESSKYVCMTCAKRG